MPLVTEEEFNIDAISPGVSDTTNTKPTVRTDEANIEDVITSNLPGKKQVVTYYNRIKSATSDEVGFDSSSSIVDAMFICVEKALLFVTDDLEILSPNADGVLGSAYVHLGIVAQKGDIIVSVIGDRDVMLLVTEVTKATYDFKTIYKISYVLDSFITESIDRFVSLKNRVTESYTYDSSVYGQNKLLKTSIVNEIAELEKEFTNFVNRFNREYYDTSAFRYLYDDKNADVITDPVIDKLMSMVNIESHEFSFGIGKGYENKNVTIFDSLYDTDNNIEIQEKYFCLADSYVVDTAAHGITKYVEVYKNINDLTKTYPILDDSAFLDETGIVDSSIDAVLKGTVIDTANVKRLIGIVKWGKCNMHDLFLIILLIRDFVRRKRNEHSKISK